MKEVVPSAPGLERIAPDVFRWEVFSPHHQVALTSHAVRIGRQLFIFDPISLADGPFRQLKAFGPVAIIITNENHLRDAFRWQAMLRVPLVSSPEARLPDGPGWQKLKTTRQVYGPWRVERVAGGSPGELAFRWEGRSLVVLGDAVTHLPKYGLQLLTKKYCQDQALLRNSIRRLVQCPFQQLLMAHGRPLLSRASSLVVEAAEQAEGKEKK